MVDKAASPPILQNAATDDCHEGGQGERNQGLHDHIPQAPPTQTLSSNVLAKTPSRHGSDATVYRSSASTNAGPSAVDVCQTLNKYIAPLQDKFEGLNAKIDRTHAKLAGGMRVNVTLLEKMGKDISEMKEAVKSLTGSSAVLKAKKLEQTFPLKTKEDVEKYLTDDPEATLAMDRYRLFQ